MEDLSSERIPLVASFFRKAIDLDPNMRGVYRVSHALMLQGLIGDLRIPYAISLQRNP